MNSFENLKELVSAAQDDADKFFIKGNAAAGKRLRAHLQGIKIRIGEIRREVQDTKNARKEATS